MLNISTGIDEHIVFEAEQIADEIGMPLSTVINILLKRFVSEKGFPFDVVATSKLKPKSVIDESLLDATVKEAVADASNVGLTSKFSYLDPNTGKLVTVMRNE